MHSMPTKRSFPNRNVTVSSDYRRELLDGVSTLHTAIQLTLFPEHHPGLVNLPISDLETALIARTLLLQAEHARVLTKIDAYKARRRTELLPFLTK